MYYGGSHIQIVDWLKEHAKSNELVQVIEVGCGDGRALATMAERIPNVQSWTGVDINAEIIARNQETFAGRRELEFVTADATDWLTEHVGAGTLLMTYGGVMEYIAPETLKLWFTLIAQNRGAGVLLVEPVDPNHDLAADPESHFFGWEQSYSHNHRSLLERSGLRILRSEEEYFTDYRFVLMLAAPAGQNTAAANPKIP
ncbi:MAG: class I SAM-dependent methyltransferase [Litoreibacter sp.]|nr:class I SAM-dependent methyltransferase [Litoreibacter sp.]